MIEAMRTGAWLTRDRLRAYPLILGIGLAASLLFIMATRVGLHDQWGRPLGTDFSQVWVAGLEIRAGHPAQPYDNVAHAAAQMAAFGPSDSFYSWPYPPYFLAVAAVAALLPYLVALALWQGVTVLIYMDAVFRAGSPRAVGRWALTGAALAYPAVTTNLLHGHNGFLTAGLLATGAIMLPRRPLLGGLMLGLLVYKPQFALVVPVALLAGGHWRGAAAAGVTVVVATAASIAAFGLDPWRGFFASLAFTRHVVLEDGGPGFGKMQSAFAAVRLVGGSVPLAYVAQGLVTSVVLLALAWLWRGRADPRLKVSGFLAASLLTTPYCMDYDMVVLGPAIAALAGLGCDAGFRPYGKTVLAATWAAPLVARPIATSIGLPIGIVAMLILFWHIVQWARLDVNKRERCENATLVTPRQACLPRAD